MFLNPAVLLIYIYFIKTSPHFKERPLYLRSIPILQIKISVCGHLIPAGTGQREFEKLIVGSKEEDDRILANKKTVLDYNEVE